VASARSICRAIRICAAAVATFTAFASSVILEQQAVARDLVAMTGEDVRVLEQRLTYAGCYERREGRAAMAEGSDDEPRCRDGLFRWSRRDRQRTNFGS